MEKPDEAESQYMEYPKINSLFMRDENHNFTQEYADPLFSCFPYWRVEEKIDGMNIRIYVNNSQHIEIKGRTNNAAIPNQLVTYFHAGDRHKKLLALHAVHGFDYPIVLYGEGFGAGIQSGGIYRPDQAFILFDTFINGRWGTRQEVYKLADELGVDHPADLGLMCKYDIIDLVKSNPMGRYGTGNYPMEGIIARCEPVLRQNTQRAEPLMWKLKARDFK